jgi:hypothetical protein
MAVYNEILVGRFNRALQKALGMKGGPPSPQLAGEITATLNLFWGVEMRYVEGWERFAIASSQIAVAAQNSRMRWVNPPNSNLLAVFEILGGSNTTGPDVLNLNNTIATPIANLATLDGPAQLDGRTRPNSSLLVSHGPSAVGMTNQRAIGARLQSTANIQLDFVLFEDQEITLTPGMSLELSEGNVNQAMTAMAVWRERFLEDSERT